MSLSSEAALGGTLETISMNALALRSQFLTLEAASPSTQGHDLWQEFLGGVSSKSRCRLHAFLVSADATKIHGTPAIKLPGLQPPSGLGGIREA